MGYAQVRKVSKNDAKNKVATMQMTKGMESLENVQSETNMIRSNGELDYTYYDWQTNSGPRNWTIVWPDGKVNFAYNIAHSSNYNDSGTGIGTYDSENDEWIPLEGRIESMETTYGSIARYRDNGIVIAANMSHSNTIGLFIVDDKDNMPSFAPLIYILDPIYEPSCPNVMTSGVNRDIIHVVATANSAYGVPGAEDVINPIIYFRSMDGGETWDKENVVLPFMGPEYGVAWGSHVVTGWRLPKTIASL
jgi:hypothetical protein